MKQACRAAHRAAKLYPTLPATFLSAPRYITDHSAAKGRTVPFLLIPDFITEIEHDALVSSIEKDLKRRRYEAGHWDAVITQYREISKSVNNFSQPAQDILTRAFQQFPRAQTPMPAVHVLDLAEDGAIDHHIDSVKFSGEIVCGLSLLSDAVMELRYDPDSLYVRDYVRGAEAIEKNMAGAADAPRIRFKVPRRSLYMLIDESRYEWSHAVLGKADSNYRQDATGEMLQVARQRRISLILRDEMPAQP